MNATKLNTVAMMMHDVSQCHFRIQMLHVKYAVVYLYLLSPLGMHCVHVHMFHYVALPGPNALLADETPHSLIYCATELLPHESA